MRRLVNELSANKIVGTSLVILSAKQIMCFATYLYNAVTHMVIWVLCDPARAHPQFVMIHVMAM